MRVQILILCLLFKGKLSLFAIYIYIYILILEAFKNFDYKGIHAIVVQHLMVIESHAIKIESTSRNSMVSLSEIIDIEFLFYILMSGIYIVTNLMNCRSIK